MKNPAVSPIFADCLQRYRRELDELDDHLISLLATRFAITRSIGALKAEHGVAAADPARERAQLERLLGLAADLGLPIEVTRAVFETLFRFVRANHRTLAGAQTSASLASDPGDELSSSVLSDLHHLASVVPVK